jgi:hypothetical protein
LESIARRERKLEEQMEEAKESGLPTTVTIAGKEYIFPLVVKNPDEEREITLPNYPYEKDEDGEGEHIVNLSFQEDIDKRNAALNRISEERRDVYNVWMLEQDHELAYAFTPLFYQGDTRVVGCNDDGEEEIQDSVCDICKCTDEISQLGVYSFPFHCRPRRHPDHWDWLDITVCLDCYFIAGHLFPTWSRGRDDWDAIDGWQVTVEDNIAPMLKLLQKNCDAFAAGEPVDPGFDPRWIGYLQKMQNKERFSPTEEA